MQLFLPHRTIMPLTASSVNEMDYFLQIGLSVMHSLFESGKQWDASVTVICTPTCQPYLTAHMVTLRNLTAFVRLFHTLSAKIQVKITKQHAMQAHKVYSSTRSQPRR